MITHLCWQGDDHDLRVFQVAFALLVGGAIAARALGGRAADLGAWQVAGVAVPIAAAVVVIVVPSHRRSHALTRTTAVLDIAALGMLGAGADLGMAAPLAVLPALCLGVDLGVRGAVLAVGATLVFITGPELVAHGVDAVRIEQLVILPVIVGMGALAITSGVTAARKAQARAEAREAELEKAMWSIERNRRSAHAIFEVVDIGLSLIDRHGEPLLANQRLMEFAELAYPNGNVADGWVFDERGSTRLAVEDIPTTRACRGEEFDDVRVWIGEEPDTRKAMSISARRVDDQEGELWGAAISYSDITELMRALQVKDEFVALVSHELRTPLTSIMGYVAVLLERDDLDPALRRHLEVVARNARRLHRLVRDLLDEAQLTCRTEPLVERPTDLATIVQECVDAARPHADRAGVVLQMDAPGSLAYAGDAQRLGQVVDNLVSNAIKYTAAGGSATVHLEGSDGSAVLRVRDTGVGICPEDREQLFNRFFRTREATLGAIPGVGLGLSIAKAIVESHGGVIEVESEVGRGSEFRVVLPIEADRLAS
ncbi:MULTISPECIES: sensor histidine kinase [unclassified Nocardioides]|uniref:sensor histidine kinase n=1 Tax=unclassified Nocardioides TaxID=2615069 RepID=UPI0036167CE7